MYLDRIRLDQTERRWRIEWEKGQLNGWMRVSFVNFLSMRNHNLMLNRRGFEERYELIHLLLLCIFYAIPSLFC